MAYHFPLLNLASKPAEFRGLGLQIASHPLDNRCSSSFLGHSKSSAGPGSGLLGHIPAVANKARIDVIITSTQRQRRISGYFVFDDGSWFDARGPWLSTLHLDFD
jgi:hypothetical protein